MIDLKDDIGLLPPNELRDAGTISRIVDPHAKTCK
jgi:hypothetical protein